MELLFATVSLFAVTILGSFIYYRRIRQAQAEYEGSKDLVRSITLGFTQQFTKQLRVINGIKRDSSDAQLAATEALKVSQDAMEAVREDNERTKRLAERMDKTEKAFASMSDEMQKLVKMPRAAPLNIEVEAPIPLRQEAVLEQLTQTELEVLALIEEAGEGSVPEIRKRIEKTREHTARLLKKLFDKGFIDRNTSSMPYRYYIRKEIKELIQQQRESMRITF